MTTAKHFHLHGPQHHPISIDEIRQIVADHDDLPEDRRVFDDPPMIEVPQHCTECGQNTDSVVFGWDLLRDTALLGGGLPVYIGTICDRCQQEGS